MLQVRVGCCTGNGLVHYGVGIRTRDEWVIARALRREREFGACEVRVDERYNAKTRAQRPVVVGATGGASSV
jgi:hypothetical protein